MKQWNNVFKNKGKFFLKPQEDMPKISRLFRENKTERVLDLGCGSGRHTIYLAKKGFAVYGIDAAPKGIQIAKDWLKKEKLRAKLKIGNIYKRLPYPDNFFDAMVSTQSLHHNRIGNIRRLIKEIERTLRPGGFIFITVNRKRPKKDIPKERLWEIKIIAPRTYIPLSHDEKGLVHYWFNKKLLRKEFKNFKINRIWIDSIRSHYCFLGKLKNAH